MTKRRSIAGRVVPGLIMTAAAAVPVWTTAEILTHVSSTGAASGLGSVPAAAGTSPPATSAPARSTRAPTQPPPSTPTPTPTQAPAAAVAVKHTYVGAAVQDQFGVVQATVTMVGKKIESVSISAPMDNPQSANINSQVVPMLQNETLQAQSAQVNLISGATLTSEAYQQSLQSALDQAQQA